MIARQARAHHLTVQAISLHHNLWLRSIMPGGGYSPGFFRPAAVGLGFGEDLLAVLLHVAFVEAAVGAEVEVAAGSAGGGPAAAGPVAGTAHRAFHRHRFVPRVFDALASPAGGFPGWHDEVSSSSRIPWDTPRERRLRLWLIPARRLLRWRFRRRQRCR